MVTYELKRYKIRQESHKSFFEAWRPITKLRRKHGFDILFALFDRESGWFTWAISHPDFDAAAGRYYADPDRILFDNIVDYVEDHEIKRVDYIPTP